MCAGFADGRPLPKHLKAQISRELDRLELLLKQIKAVETERDALLAAQRVAAPASAAMLLDIKASVLSSLPRSRHNPKILWADDAKIR